MTAGSWRARAAVLCLAFAMVATASGPVAGGSRAAGAGITWSAAPVVVNATGVRVVIVAVELESATRYDPARTLELGVGDERVLVPGEVRELEAEAVVGGYRPGDGLQLYVYRVSGQRAVLAGTRTVAPDELEAAQARVVLSAAAIGRAPARPDDVLGCYDLEVTGLDLQSTGADSVFYRPPPRVVLVAESTEPPRRGHARAGEGGPIAVPEGSVPAPHEIASWRLQGIAVELVWSTGHIGLSATVTPTPDGLAGEAYRFTDVVPPHFRDLPRGRLTARRVDCDAPTPYPMAAIPRFFDPIPLAGGAVLALRQPIPESVRRSPTRLARKLVLHAEPVGPLAGADTLVVDVTEGGAVRSIHLRFPLADRDRIRDRLVRAHGPWHADDAFFDVRQWIWQGRLESIALSTNGDRYLGLTFTAEGMRW